VLGVGAAIFWWIKHRREIKKREKKIRKAEQKREAISPPAPMPKAKPTPMTRAIA